MAAPQIVQTNNSSKRWLVGILSALLSYLALYFLGQQSEANKAIQASLKGPLGELLSASVGWVTALIIPKLGRPIPPATTTGTDSTARTEVERLQKALREWQTWGEGLVEAYKVLDKKQANLRLSLYGMVAFGVASSIAGFHAPELAPENFRTHVGYLAGAYAVVGIGIGLTVNLLTINTSWRDALRTALLSASVLNISAFLISLPYAFQSMWEKKVVLFGFDGPLLVVMLVARILLFPILSSVSAVAGYLISRAIWGERTL